MSESVMQVPRVVLKAKREASVLRRHPWIFSGSIDRVEGGPGMGALVAVVSARREFLAWGHYSPHSQIRVRLLSWEESPIPEGPDFWRARIDRALALRRDLFADPTTTAFRLLYAESDGLPGLIVDLYGETLVAQFLTAATDLRRELLSDLLWERVAQQTPVRTLFERSDADVREREGLIEGLGLLRGEEPPPTIEILENGLTFLVDVRSGHKTGFYLDQRANRQRLRELVARRVARGEVPDLLNVFAYTGGFAVYALAGGVRSVVNVDTSADVLALGQEIYRRNGQDATGIEDVAGDAFKVLRRFRQQGRQFDMVVLDPPKFAFTRRDVQSASRGYKDINLQAIHLLKPGGTLLTFSCSGAIDDDLFQKIVFGAALDTGRDVQIVGRLMQGSDHPIALTFPEGAYLKGLVCRVVA